MIFVVLSIFLFAFNNVLWKKNLNTFELPVLMAFRSFFTSTIAIFTLLVLNISLSDYFNQFLTISIGSFFGFIGLLCMLTALKQIPLQWLGIYNLMSVLLSAFYMSVFEEIDIQSSIPGASLILLGFLYYLVNNRSNQFHITFKSHFFLIVMSISFLTSSIIHWKNLKSEIPPVVILWNQESIVFISSIVILLFLKGRKSLSNMISKIQFKPILAMALVIFLALLFSLIGINNTNPYISSMLFLSNPLVTILFSMICFRESIQLKSFISIFLIVTGAFLLHLSTQT